ncbi:MAG: hypothetical protein WCV68_03465 [Candidatus Paceibacterota bacterium]|jgi:hypothetical protein
MAGVARLNSRAIRYLVANKNYFRVLVIQMGKNNFPDGDGDFSKSPYFKFNDDQVKFDTNDVDDTNDNYGSASVFPPVVSPKSLLLIKEVAKRLATSLS